MGGGMLNAASFGAIGDGIADDGEAIQEALSLAPLSVDRDGPGDAESGGDPIDADRD
jgi:hypothetical protein